MSLVVPGRLTKRACCPSHPAMSKQCDQREQSQESRCSSPYCQIRPLPLCLEPKMPSHLLKSYLQLPAHHKPTENLLRIRVKGGTQEGLGFELFLRITDQHPAHRYGEQACGVPHGRLRSDFYHALPAPIPVRDRSELPNGGR